MKLSRRDPLEPGSGIYTEWSIDPGISGCGVTVWDGSIQDRLQYPLKVINIYPKTKLYSASCLKPVWVTRVWSEMDQIEKLSDEYPLPVRVHCEIPHFMEGATADAATRTSSIGKLFSHVGAIQEFCRSRGFFFRGYEVREWKGQLPKTVVISRITRLLPEIKARLKVSSHGWDSVGIGLYGNGYRI